MPVITNIPKQEAAALALKNRLFISGWTLNGLLHLIKDGNNGNRCFDIILYKKQNKFVGVAVKVIHKASNEIVVFVRKSERRKGIGTELISKLKTKKSEAGYGIVGSKEFWKKVNIRMHY